VELWRYYRILRRRRWLILLCIVVVVGFVGSYCFFLTPKLWVGATVVMERQPMERGVPVYDPRFVPAYNIQPHMNDLAAIASSEVVISRAADTLNSAFGIPVGKEDLAKRVNVEPEADTQMLSVQVVWDDETAARDAVDVITNEFQRRYRELMTGATEKSREFIEKQLKDAKARLQVARQARKNYQVQNKVVEVPVQTQALIQRISEIEFNAIQAQAAAQEKADQLRALDSELLKEPEMRLVVRVTAENPVYQQLLTRRVQAEADLGGMLATRGRNHPEVQALQKQIDKLNVEIKNQAPKIVSQENTERNRLLDSALSSRLQTNADQAGATARARALQSALDQKQVELHSLPEQDMRMAQLELDIKNAEQTYSLLLQKLDEAKIKSKETTEANAIQVMAPPRATPVDPKTGLKLALALILSPLLGAGLAFLLNYLDNTVKTPAEAEDLLGLPVVTVVPLARSHSLARRPENQPILATYEMLTTILWSNVAKSSCPVVLVASAEPDVGRTTTAANLAVTLARDGARVILVDADMRKPDLHTMFGVASKPGLSNILAGAVAIEDALVPTKVEGLLFLPAGPTPDNPVRLLRSQQMTDFVAQIGTIADFVVFDSPAGITFADASLVASVVKNVVLVHSAGRVPRGAESEFRNKLDLAGANILGAVLNRVRPEDSHGYFHYRRFYADLTIQERTRVAALGGVRAIPPGSDGTASGRGPT